MRFKLDENIAADLVDILTGAGHDVDTVPQELLSGRPDDDVWDAAQEAERFLITQDLDFADIRRFPVGTHHGILLVRLSNASRQDFIDRVGSLFLNEPIETWQGCIVVVTDRKIRVRGPSEGIVTPARSSPTSQAPNS